LSKQSKTISKPSLYIVKWLDILSDPTWVGGDPATAEPATCVTVGWLVHSCDKKVVLADSKTGGGDWGGVTVIPSGVVLDKHHLLAESPEIFLKEAKSPGKKK